MEKTVEAYQCKGRQDDLSACGGDLRYGLSAGGKTGKRDALDFAVMKEVMKIWQKI